MQMAERVYNETGSENTQMKIPRYFAMAFILGLIMTGTALSQVGITSGLPYLGRRANDTAAGPCTPARSGFTYFNTTTNLLRTCDGTSWENTGLSSGGSGDMQSSNNLSDVANATTARANLGLTIGTHVQAFDSDLAAIAGLSPTNGDVIQRISGVWANRSISQLKTDLAIAGLSVTITSLQDGDCLVASSGTFVNSPCPSGGGSGDVTGPESATANAIARFSGTGGKTIQNSGLSINNDGDLVMPIGQGIIDNETDPRLTIGETATTITGAPVALNGNVVFRHPSFFDYLLAGPEDGIRLREGYPIGWTPGALESTAPDVGIARSSAGTLAVTDGSSGSGTLTAAQLHASNRIRFPRVTAFPDSPAAGDVVIVTDDSATGACDSAAGSATSLCQYNGSAWVSLGDGSTAGSGDVATDEIWDAKGDIAAGTGSNTAQRLAAGANDTMLMADSATTTGLKWADAATIKAALSLSNVDNTADANKNVATAAALAANPTDCSANQFATTIAANGNLTCAAVTTSFITDANVTFAKFQDLAGLSIVGRSADTTGVTAAITASTDGHVLRRSSTSIGFGTIATAGIADAAVTLAKIQNFTANTVPARAAGTSGVLSQISLSASNLLGRGSTGNIAAITLGSGLTMTGTELTATAAPGGSNTQLQFNNSSAMGGVSGATSDGTNVTFGSGNLRATLPRFTTGIADANGNEAIRVAATTSAVNDVTVTNAATGNAPTISASGDDTNIDLVLTGKGTGGVRIAGDAAGSIGLLDTDQSHYLNITPGSNLTADRTLTVTTGDANRNLTINGDATLVAGTMATTAQLAAQTYQSTIVVDSPTDAENIGILWTEEAITITRIVAVLRGSDTPSVTWSVRYNTDRSDTGAEVVTGGTTTTSTTTGSNVTSFNSAEINSENFIWLTTSAQSGTVGQLQVTIIYTKQ